MRREYNIVHGSKCKKSKERSPARGGVDALTNSLAI
jgi:hypothetical protein